VTERVPPTLDVQEAAKAPQTWSLGLVLLAAGEELLELKSDVKS
jgi:hypothetical protein